MPTEMQPTSENDFECLANTGGYTPVLAKNSKNFSLEESLAVGVERMQRNCGGLKQHVDEWQAM